MSYDYVHGYGRIRIWIPGLNFFLLVRYGFRRYILLAVDYILFKDSLSFS
jgi:hypothetical protein